MTIKTFWTILIKILGMLLVLGALTIIPQWFSTMYYTYESGDIESLIILNVILLVVLVIYNFVVRICLFRTSWIIDKLKLDNDFENQQIELNSESYAIISIATIVIGGIMFTESIPTLLKDIFIFFQQRSALKDYPNTCWIFFNFVKIIIGYLLMTNSKQIAKFIESKKSDREDMTK